MSKDRELMQQALEALNHVNVQDRVQIIAALRERLAQPEQEPVAWIHGDEYGDACHWVGGRMPPAGTKLYTTPPQRKPQQAEPVEPVGAAGLFTLAHLWAQQCYFKGLGRPCDIDSAKGAFEQALLQAQTAAIEARLREKNT